MALFRTSSQSGTAIKRDTVTVSTSGTTKVTLGFKPKHVDVYFRTDSTHWRLLSYDEDISSTSGFYTTRIGSSEGTGEYSFTSTETGSLASIDNDGFTLASISSSQASSVATTGTYIAY